MENETDVDLIMGHALWQARVQVCQTQTHIIQFNSTDGMGMGKCIYAIL